MNLIWEVDDEDIKNIKEFCASYKSTHFYVRREQKNIDKQNLDLSKEFFWRAMATCLLTTQQKSSSESPVSNFCRQVPFALELNICMEQKNLQHYVSTTISNFGGIRRHFTIAEELHTNFQKLENTSWQLFETILFNFNKPYLDSKMQIEKERLSAELIHDELKGFGPKQSRNLLQILGLTMYEIPIDSRIIKWLNNFGFPLKVSPISLQDKNYYNLISDGIHNLCEKAEIKPCLLDAAIFVNADKGVWTKANSVF